MHMKIITVASCATVGTANSCGYACDVNSSGGKGTALTATMSFNHCAAK